MMNFTSIFVVIIYVFLELDIASSYYESLVILESDIAPGKITLPYKATESDGKISYPEIDEDKKDHLYLCHPQSPDPIKKYIEKTSSEYFPNDLYCLTDYSKIGSSKDCPTEVKPLLADELIHDQGDLRDCGTSVNHKLYHFGFNYCEITPNPFIFIKIASRLLSIYDICLNTNTSKPFWTKHQIRTGFMLKEELPSQDLGNNIELSTEAFKSKYDARSEDIFEKQAEKYKNHGPNQIHKMIPQQLVPHEDIAIKLWKKTTTHYVNTAPLWVELVPLMKSINNGIRKAAVKVNLESYDEKINAGDNLDIYTTTYSHHSAIKRWIHNIDRFNFLKEPFGWNIWCKFIHYPNKNQGIMIFLHNLPGNPPVKLYPARNHSQEESLTKQTETNDEENSNKQTQSLMQENRDTKNSKIDKLLKEKECELQIFCGFEKWSSGNQPEQSLSDDLLEYAYCCEVNKEKVKQLFGIELENEITLLDIENIITNDSKDLDKNNS